jgi:hypothetical protein
LEKPVIKEVKMKALNIFLFWATIKMVAVTALAAFILTGCATITPEYKGNTVNRTLDAACKDSGILMVCLYRGFQKETSEVDCYECSQKGRDPNLTPDGSQRK